MTNVNTFNGRNVPSASEPDWQREELRRWWDPSRQLIRSIRRYQAAVAKGGLLARFVRRYWVLQHRFWSVVCGADIPINVHAEGGLLLPHPNGIVIHPSVRIGVNCAIFQQVTMVGDIVVGGQVEIGAGAKIVRAVTLGDRAVVGANAVVLKDVPAGATVVGIPAVPIAKS